MTQGDDELFGPLFAPKRRDDMSTHRHRVVIGVLGAALPLLVWIVSRARPVDASLSEPLNSISAYYYSGAAAIFTGVLACLAVYFLTYNGYRNKDRWKDRTAAGFAAVAAIGVACFPTRAPLESLKVHWWQPYLHYVHLASAGVLFLSFIVFALFLFPQSSREKVEEDKRKRNIIYYVCGGVMLVCVVWAGFRAQDGKQIFWHEAVALEFFSLSWLVKGRGQQTAGQVLIRVRHPVRFAKHVVKQLRHPPEKKPTDHDDESL